MAAAAEPPQTLRGSGASMSGVFRKSTRPHSPRRRRVTSGARPLGKERRKRTTTPVVQRALTQQAALRGAERGLTGDVVRAVDGDRNPTFAFHRHLRSYEAHCQTMSRSATSTRLLNTSRDGDSTTSLGSLFQCLITLSVKKNFLISSLNLPWRNLRPFPLVLSLVTWEKRLTPLLYNLLSVVESNKVSPQPPFLQAKQPQFPQPLLIRLVLQTLHQLRHPSLDTLQPLNVSLVVRGPKLNTGFEVRPHQCRVQGHDHFPTLAGHTIFDTSQDAIGLLGHLGTLLAHIQAAVNQHPQVLFHRAAFQPLFPKPVALHGVAVAQVQDLALGLVEPHTIGLGPSIQPVQVPLQSLPTLKQINTPTQLGVICKLTEGALDPFVQIIDKDIKQNWPQHRALGNTACDRPPTGFNSIHHNSLGPAIQPDFYPAMLQLSHEYCGLLKKLLQQMIITREPRLGDHADPRMDLHGSYLLMIFDKFTQSMCKEVVPVHWPTLTFWENSVAFNSNHSKAASISLWIVISNRGSGGAREGGTQTCLQPLPPARLSLHVWSLPCLYPSNAIAKPGPCEQALIHRLGVPLCNRYEALDVEGQPMDDVDGGPSTPVVLPGPQRRLFSRSDCQLERREEEEEPAFTIMEENGNIVRLLCYSEQGKDSSHSSQVLHGLQVEICSTVNLYGLQGDSLPCHGLHHGLQGNLCSSTWSTSSHPSSLTLNLFYVKEVQSDAAVTSLKERYFFNIQAACLNSKGDKALGHRWQWPLCDNIIKKRKKLLWNSSQKRGVRICERNNSADTKVSEGGGGGGAPGTGAELPLQLMVKTMVRQAVPLRRMEVNGGADLHLQPVEDPTLEQVDVPEGGWDPVGNLHWSRLLAGPVIPWREEPTLEWVFWQDL
ncbi:LOW QUALITY PROTEIN: hypothetical protein QYF61_015413 [Mycteria americana]|uniref:Uncharacterized protein n=1 Tax=Mycteria americana TaxID=33587 RepID=A0AAN7S7G6_MYCAM|nr:LOW QUALITY PROTEIN: hypothetical protein QYF61_015413 [Mycteria americana]